MTDASVTANRARGFWNEQPPGPVRPGSDRHKAMFCRMLLDTFNPYKPAIIDWPKLDEAVRQRLVGLPIWDIAVQTEGKAKLRVLSYGETVADPLLREAIALNGFEEGRHKTVLANMVEAYGIKLEAEPPYRTPRDPEWAFMVTGYSECIDSFFAFGLFETAKRSGFFPPELRRHLRAGDAGGRPAHPILRQLGRVAPAQSAVVAAALVHGEDPGRLGVPGLGAHRHCARHEWPATRQ